MVFDFKKIIYLLPFLSVILGCGIQVPGKDNLQSRSDRVRGLLYEPNKNLEDLEKEELLNQVEKAIYQVEGIKEVHNNIAVFSQGTGFFISEDLFVTALHVIQDIPNVHKIFLYPGKNRSSPPVQVESLEYVSVYADLAILRTRTRSSYFLQKGLEVPLNKKLTLIGYPAGRFKRWESETFSIQQPYSPIYIIEFNSDGKNKGASGSPLLNSKGEFVGIDVMLRGEKNHLFISSENVDKLLNEEIGRKCTAFKCIEEEFQMAQNHIEGYAYNKESIPLDSEIFFHLPTQQLLRISDKNAVLFYLSKGMLQEEGLSVNFFRALFYLINITVQDFNINVNRCKKLAEERIFEFQQCLYSNLLNRKSS